jgi:N-acetylglucosamine transport system substrate-binding protein
MGADINNEMAPRWLSGDPPDFAFVDGREFPDDELLKKGLLMDLKEFFDTSRTEDGTALIRDNLYKGFIPETDGKIYFAPYIFGTLGMWYNAKFFKDSGLKVPTNFEEFLGLAAELKEKNVALLNYPGVYPNYLYLGFVRQNLALEGGQQIFDDILNLKPGVFVSEPFYKSLYKIEELSKTDNSVLKSSLSMDHIQSQREWLNGKSAFIPNGLWLENEMKNDIPADFEMAFIPSLIQDKGQKYVVCAYAHDLCLARDGKNPEAARAWLAFLYREDIMRRFTEITGVPTAYKMDLSDANVSERVKNVQKWIADPDILFLYNKEMHNEVTTAMYNSLNDIITGKATAREACREIQAVADRVAAEQSKD